MGGILRPQVETRAFFPVSTFEVAAPRPLTVEDHGKFILMGGLTGGWYDLPPWEDVPDGFSVQMTRHAAMADVTGYEADWEFFYGFQPAPSDYISYCVAHDTQFLGQPGQGIGNVDFQSLILIFKDSVPNRWTIATDQHSYGMFARVSDQLRISGNPSTWGFSVYPWAGLAYRVSIEVNAEDGSDDPLGRVFGSYDLQTGVFTDGPDGSPDGPALPVHWRFHAYGGSAWVADLSYIYAWFNRPPFTYESTNLLRQPGASDLGIYPIEGGGHLNLAPGESLSVYTGNGLEQGGNWRFYLRQAPGEPTPRSWAEAYALGPW